MWTGMFYSWFWSFLLFWSKRFSTEDTQVVSIFIQVHWLTSVMKHPIIITKHVRKVWRLFHWSWWKWFKCWSCTVSFWSIWTEETDDEVRLRWVSDTKTVFMSERMNGKQIPLFTVPLLLQGLLGNTRTTSQSNSISQMSPNQSNPWGLNNLKPSFNQSKTGPKLLRNWSETGPKLV